MFKQVAEPYGLYKVSDEGFVVGPRGHKLVGKVTWDGYREVVLSCGGVRRSVRVHILLMETFVGPRPEKQVINHKNCDKLDNRLENLEYVSLEENVRHGYSSDCYQTAKSRMSSISDFNIKLMERLHGMGYSLAHIAKKIGWPESSSSYIHEVLKGRKSAWLTGFTKETYKRDVFDIPPVKISETKSLLTQYPSKIVAKLTGLAWQRVKDIDKGVYG